MVLKIGENYPVLSLYRFYVSVLSEVINNHLGSILGSTVRLIYSDETHSLVKSDPFKLKDE